MQSNRLIHESSPYLQQHAHNPVNWYPWGKEALQKAKDEDKPILVSIGYSTCHWCHVMERESFENTQIASLMNEVFVCIKVDREERPDIDAIYMDSLQSMGVRGGWPLNVFLMPDTKPFYGGTYFPPQNFINLIKSIQRAFQQQREELQKSADGFAENLLFKETEKYALSDEIALFTEADIEQYFQTISKEFDSTHGGLSRSPKFPMPSVWLFLLHYLAKNPNNQFAIEQLKLSLDRMALGGIFDHLGGGWTRYSTDNIWKVPHFEKMLYDNGQLLSLYAQAYCFFNSKNVFPESTQLYKWAIYQTIEWLEREMTSTEGGFYSAQDADSEGQEGKFYVWQKEEIEHLLNGDTQWFNQLYKITNFGNWEDENNILHLEKLPESSEWEKAKTIHKKLFIERDKRIKPSLDNKILCSWNALMLNGLIDSYRHLNDAHFLNIALKNAQYIQKNLTTSIQINDKSVKKLWHSTNKIIAFLDDYATVIQAYINLYQVTFDENWLHESSLLMEYTIHHFLDLEENLFYYTDIEGETLIARKKEIFDNVIPSSNSMMANNLHKLGVLLENVAWAKLSEKMLSKMKPLLEKDAQWLSNWAILASKLANPMLEVALVGNNIESYRNIIDNKKYQPNKLFVGTKNISNLPLLQDRVAINEQTTIYICQNKTCQLPLTEIEKVEL